MIQQPIISKSKWVDDLHKNATQYKAEELNLLQSYLQTDFHLNKIYKKLLYEDINIEYKTFNSLQKQLKFYINEAYSFLVGKRITKADCNEFQKKINKIENLLHKTRSDYKSKFDTLLTEEATLQQELENYDTLFMQEFSKEQENKLREYYNNRINQDEDVEALNKMNQNLKNYTILNMQPHQKNENVNSENSNLDIIDKYINCVMTNVNYSAYGMNDDEITFNDIEKLIKKMNNSHLNLIKIKTDILNSIIEKKLGGNYLGWESKEHEEFLKLRINYNYKINTYEFLTALSNTIPYIPVSELKNHINLFEKFEKLNDIKKLLLSKYKEIKKIKESKEKEKKLKTLKENKANYQLEQKERERKFKIQEERRQKVLEWKQNKLKEDFEKKQKLYEDEKKQKQKEKEIYYMNKQKNQYILEDYHKKKEEQEYLKKLYEEEKNKKKEINQFDIERIKEKEENLLEKKITAKRINSAKKLKTEINYQNFKIKEKEKMKNIPSKYQQMNTNYNNRKREKFDPSKDQPKDACTMANNVLGRGSRAIPIWRKGLK